MENRGSGASRPRLDHVLSKWARLGIGFDIEPARRTPDLERLISDTATIAGESARLVGMAATWLARYAMLVARHRLRAIVLTQLADDDAPALGLMLESAARFGRTRHFDSVIATCESATKRGGTAPRPLFDSQRGWPAIEALADRRASDLSRRWRRWAQDIEFRDDVLRSPTWIMQRNPSLRRRADLGGDLRASILATILHDPTAGDSELELSRRCAATRRAVRLALDQLELAGHIERRAVGRRVTIALRAAA